MLIMLASAAGGALCVILGVWGISLYKSGERVSQDWAEITSSKPKRKSDTFIIALVADMVGGPFTKIALDLMAPRKAKIRRRIDAAGRPNGMTVESYAKRTAGYVVIFGSLSLVLLAAGNIIFGLVALIACFQNEMTLYAKAKQRQEDIERSLPDFLDVLSVTVTAGLSFRHALQRVAESMPGALADEFTVALRQMELGTSRRDAFDDLRKRNRSEALSQFVTAIQQAEELGAPLANALSDIGVDVRREAAQSARRKAQRTTPQITAVSTALALPALMLIVLGAMFFSSGTNLGGVLGH